MNKTFFTILLSVFFAIHNVNAKPIKEEKVKQFAKNWAQEKWKKKVDHVSTKEKVTAQQYGTDETLYYVLSFPQGGWMIVSGDDVAYPVIAFSPTGTYSEQDRPIQFEEWMEDVKKDLSSAIKAKHTPLPKASAAWKHFNVKTDSFFPDNSSSVAKVSAANVAVEPLLSTEWGQGDYYNQKCPDDSNGPDDHALVGCVAVAMGQVMKYHNYPSTGSGSHSYYHPTYGWQAADFGETAYKWTSMPNSLFSDDSDVAKLLYHVGISVDMEYGSTSSGAVTKDTAYALKKYFKYSNSIRYVQKKNYSTGGWTALLRAELNNSRPVIYRGRGDAGGHAFVCDGYSDSDHFHFNWGWYGSYQNVYFYLNDLTPGSHSLSENQAAVIGIVPPNEPPAPGKLPDFIVDKVTIANKSGNKEKYTWKINETAYVHAWVDNIGIADWEGSADKIKVPFYLSKGTKEDSHSEWVRAGREEIKKNKLVLSKSPKHEYIKFNLADWANESKVLPGRTYNFVVCADRPKDENNGDGDVKEKHKSNNCSTEAVFYVDYGPARNVDLMADMLALTGGRTELQAGERYGLQVEVSNIGTEQPWNGFSTSYGIKGPGTGGVWQKIGEDSSKASNLYPGATHFEAMDGDDESDALMVGGDYVFRACADYEQVVPETDEGNNCTELEVYIVPPPMPDLIVQSLKLNSGGTTLTGNRPYGLTVNVQNIGDADANSNFHTSFEIKGPGTGNKWKIIGDGEFDITQLAFGAEQQYSTSDSFESAPKVAGDYVIRSCVDYQGAVPEHDEGNNCTELEVYVSPTADPLLDPVYRFWSDNYHSHFYTIFGDEKDRVIAKDDNWQYEHIEYYAYTSQVKDSLPVYRFWSDNYHSHFYTIDENEKNRVIAEDPNWRFEFVAWYAYKPQYPGTVPLYRFWSDTYMSHFYTASEKEKNDVIADYPDEVWRYEFIAWWVFPR